MIGSQFTSCLSSSGRPGRLSRGVVFEMLRNRRRRYVFHYLRRQERPVPLRELSDYVAACEVNENVDTLDDTARQRVYISLIQTHLPKMDDADIVDFDGGENVVELADNAADVEVYLEAVPDGDITWSQFYFGVALMGTAYLLFAWLGISFFPSLAGVVGLALIGTFALTAIVHHRQLRRGRLGARNEPL